MHYFTMKLAGVPLGVFHRYPYIKALCADYATQEPPALTVSVTGEQIQGEKALTGGKFPDSLCEATCLHREIVKALVPRGILLIHGAAVALDGEAYVFLAKSGVGKSTHIRLWQERFGPRARVVNGDKPMFSYVEGVLTVHGSPWRGKEGWGENIALPVRAICLLERGRENHIAPCPPDKIVPALFRQVLMPTAGADAAVFLGLLNRIIQTTPIHRLQCNMEPQAAQVAWEGMRKE